MDGKVDFEHWQVRLESAFHLVSMIDGMSIRKVCTEVRRSSDEMNGWRCRLSILDLCDRYVSAADKQKQRDWIIELEYTMRDFLR